MQATITSKGQITLPKKLRDALSLSVGDKVEFVIDDNDMVRLIPKHVSIRSLKGMLPKPKKAVSLEAMDEAIEQGKRSS